MWACPKPATALNKALVPSVSGTPSTWRRQWHGVSANTKQQGGKLDDTLLGKSNPLPIPKESGEISGSDVLWALQRASGHKKNMKNKKELDRRRDSSSAATEENALVDYTNVRPLRINANWAAKFDDFDKRLRNLSDTI